MRRERKRTARTEPALKKRKSRTRENNEGKECKRKGRLNAEKETHDERGYMKFATTVLAPGQMARNHGQDETGVDCLVVSCCEAVGQMEIRY